MPTASDRGLDTAVHQLRCSDPHGRPLTRTVRFGPWHTPAGALASVRPVTAADGGPDLAQKAVLTDLGRRAGYAYEMLENEARIAARLSHRYDSPYAYPPELVRLVGYDLDGEEPFLLFAPPRGVSLAGAAADLHSAALRQLEESLLRGVLALASSQVVHGALTPQTVRWDGQCAQITELGYARLTGEESPPQTTGWAAPEQRAGGHRARLADDVWGAGAVIYHVVTGAPMPATGAPRLTNRGEALRALLDGVFTEPAERRPDVATLLRRLRVEPSPPDGAALTDPAFAAGGHAFDERLARKRASLRPAPTPAPPPLPRRRRSWLWGGATALLLVTLGVMSMASGVGALLAVAA
ncbi:MAG TPA: hypothetical protein VFB84_06070 [Micromonosporaceae bacterium]|nr:hypothetical protein [Micromonosporaceae bacterium]